MRTSQQQIFFEKQPDLPMIEAQVQYLGSKQNENEYLSQFIFSPASENIQQNSIPQQNSIAKQNLIAKSDQPKTTQAQNAMNSCVSSERNAQNPTKNRTREKSSFHNFQKHLVITLRNVVKLGKYTKSQQVQHIAGQMWESFVRSTLYNKRFLYVLFGVHGNNDENQFSKSFLKELGYMEIFAKYSEQSIRQAQDYLRKQIIKQFAAINLKGYLHYRKIKRMSQFQKYIEQFIQEIRQGSVRKRLPKDRKLTMIVVPKDKQTSPELLG